MSLTPDLITSQSQSYLPFLYKFYFEHNKLGFFQTISAHFYKEPAHLNSTVLSFVVAGLQTVQHTNQGYSYHVTERLVKVYDLVLPQSLLNEQTQTGKISESHKMPNNQTTMPEIKEKNKLFYDKDITCFEELIVTQKRSSEYQTSLTFYALALKNESIRIINASLLIGHPAPKRSSFLSDRSPFLVMIYLNEAKNANLASLSVGNSCEAAIIPLQKQVTTMKFNAHDMLLLCGCVDGTVVMVNLNYHMLSQGQTITSGYRFFSYHNRPVRDLAWMTYSSEQKHSFVSLADDGFVIWNKQSPTLPVCEITQPTRMPNSLIEVYPDQFIVSGRDCSLKFFDIKKGYSYTYYENSEIITKLYNLTGQIQYPTKSGKVSVDASLRFIACEHTGKIVFWQGEREFEHQCHKGKIAAVDFLAEFGGVYLAVEKENSKLSVFSPILFTHCLQETD